MKSKIIFSVHHAQIGDDAHARNHKNLKSHLRGAGINYEEVRGAYKGKGEDSIMISNTDRGLKIARDYARTYWQESIMLINAEGNAHLENWKGEKLADLGTMRTVSGFFAISSGNWTRVNGQYWVAA